MLVETITSSLVKALATDATDSSFPSKIPTNTEPSGNGVIDLSKSGGAVQNAAYVIPYATAGDNDTFSMRMIGWRVIGPGNADTCLWIPVVLCELACTCSAVVGVANKVIVATERFVDTITVVTGNTGVSLDPVSPTGDVIAHAVVDLKGCQKLSFTFDSTAAGATAMNCLYALL